MLTQPTRADPNRTFCLGVCQCVRSLFPCSISVPSCGSLTSFSNELLSSGCGSIVASLLQDLLSYTQESLNKVLSLRTHWQMLNKHARAASVMLEFDVGSEPERTFRMRSATATSSPPEMISSRHLTSRVTLFHYK